VHNQLYDLQTLRTLNTPHQNSRRSNIRALHNIAQRLKKVENRQESDFTKLDNCSGLIAITPHTYTVHDTLKQFINTCIRDASTAITDAIPARDIDMLKAREYRFFDKQVAPSLKVSKEHVDNIHNQITSAIKEYDSRNTLVASLHKSQNTSYEAKHTAFEKDIHSIQFKF